MISTQPREVLTSAFVRLSEQAPFYIFITFVLTYGTEKLKFEKGDLLNDVLIAATVGLVCVPLFGLLSDIIGRRTMYGIGIVCMGLFAFPYYGLLNTQRSGLVMLAIVLSLVFHAMQYGPQAALISENFGTNVRYSGAGLGYQMASVIAGGPAPLIAAKILEKTLITDGPFTEGTLRPRCCTPATIRRATRSSSDGDLVLLADQDRGRWDRGLVAEGQAIVRQCLRCNQAGPYQIQAAINAVHSDTPVAAAADWALTLIDDLDLAGPHLFHAVRADLLRRLGRNADAALAYDAAIARTENATEREFLQRRRRALTWTLIVHGEIQIA